MPRLLMHASRAVRAVEKHATTYTRPHISNSIMQVYFVREAERAEPQKENTTRPKSGLQNVVVWLFMLSGFQNIGPFR
jgi:hypothetical protein